MKAMLSCLLLVPAFLAFSQSFLPDSLNKVVVLRPTGKTVGSLEEMAVVPDTAQLYLAALKAIDNSFAREIIGLYFMAQVYLKNQGRRPAVEPAYLALTQNQGGYARFGFYLQGVGAMPNTPYLDIIEKTVASPQGKLGSFTQLYPHEMGHVIYRLLSSDSLHEEESRCVDMHYFPLITDYGIAFNEGFAEHIENAARLFEPNDSLQAEIFSDIERAKKKRPLWIRGFRNDFRLPLRLAYYKATMILWYQRLEDLRRYEQAIDATVHFKSEGINKGSLEDRLTFRNSGLMVTAEPRNRSQALATEGVVSLFFTQLLHSGLPEAYRPEDFYRAFLYDTTQLAANPRELFSPLQNLFLKYFVALHHSVTFEHSDSAQALDFLEGYCRFFPEEKETIVRLFESSFGESRSQLPPEIWLMAKGHNHRLLLLDAFGAITLPVYTFDLNRAELEDLLTLPGLDEEDARRILEYRLEQGLFQSLEEAAAVKGLSPAGRQALLSGAFDEPYFKSLPDPEFSISALIITPVKRLLLHALPYLGVILLLAFVLFRPEGPLGGKAIAGRALRYTLLWLLFVTAGLAALVFTGKPLLWLAAFMVAMLLLATLVYWNKPRAMQRSLVLVVIMGVMVGYSLV